jgi:hypothetical protein
MVDLDPEDAVFDPNGPRMLADDGPDGFFPAGNLAGFAHPFG